MFLKKNYILIIILAGMQLYSCKVPETQKNQSQSDSTIFLAQYNRYDSLFNLYYKTRNTEFLKKGGLSADSALTLSILQTDTNLYKKYISLFFYRGYDFNILGAFINSKRLLEKFLFFSAENKLSKPANIADAQKILGDIYSRCGDYKKAILLLKQSLEYYYSQKNEEEAASCILNLSIPFKELRRYEEAEKILYEIFELRTIQPKRKLKAHLELADIYIRQQKKEKAGLQIMKARNLLPAILMDNDKADTYSLFYKIKSDLQLAINNPQKALTAYQQSLDSAKKASAQNLRDRKIGKIYIAMGKALEQLNFSDSALSFYNKALYTVINIDTLNNFSLPLQKDIYAENTIAEALYARANCIINRKTANTAELENAVRCYQLAFATESKLLNAFSYDESRLYMVAATRKQTEKAIGICYQLYKKTNNPHWANEAFLFAEHNKAFVLAESVRRNTAASLFLQNDTMYKKMQQLQSNLALTEIELAKQKFSFVDTALVRSLTADKQKTEEELLAAENNIRIKNPKYNEWISDEVTLSAAAITIKTLSDKNALVEYFSGDSSLYAFSAEKNKPINFYKLPDSAKNVTDRFLHFFSSQNLILNAPAQYAAAASQLYQSILKPCLPGNNKPVLIIPDGFIAYIPFDALLTSTTTSTNIASFPFLLKEREIFYAFSCKTLLAQAQHKKAGTENTLVAFAPVFANQQRGLLPLLHSTEELEAIKQLYPQGKFFTGNAATIKQFEETSGNAAVIHLATHAVPGNDSILARIELYDSSVYLNSIYTKKINAKLVVLSGCETGAGAINKTEGPISLARGFSYAGTKNVIASLWQTEDNSSSLIFKNFYSNLPGNNFSSALHKAKLSFLSNSSVPTASPYYWSGYIYIGAPEENLSSSKSSLLFIIAVTCLAIIITSFIVAGRRRKRLIR
jgi:CHAT domain-containing protein